MAKKGGGGIKIGPLALLAKGKDKAKEAVQNVALEIMGQSGEPVRSPSQILKGTGQGLARTVTGKEYNTKYRGTEYGDKANPDFESGRNLNRLYILGDETGFEKADSDRGVDFSKSLKGRKANSYKGNIYTNIDTLRVPSEYRPAFEDLANNGQTLGFNDIIGNENYTSKYQGEFDDVGGHVGKIAYDDNGNIETQIADLWDFESSTENNKYIPSRILGKVGKPFILRQNLPVKFEDRDTYQDKSDSKLSDEREYTANIFSEVNNEGQGSNLRTIRKNYYNYENDNNLDEEGKYKSNKEELGGSVREQSMNSLKEKSSIKYRPDKKKLGGEEDVNVKNLEGKAFIENWLNNRRDQFKNNYKLKGFLSRDLSESSDKAFNKQLDNLRTVKTYDLSSQEDINDYIDNSKIVDNYINFRGLENNTENRTKGANDKKWGKQGVYFQATHEVVINDKKDPEGTRIHEYSHSLNAQDQRRAISKSINRKTQGDNYNSYLDNTDEIYSRLMELRYNNKLDPNKTYKSKDLRGNVKDSKIFDRYTDEQIDYLLNEVASNENYKDMNTLKNKPKRKAFLGIASAIIGGVAAIGSAIASSKSAKKQRALQTELAQTQQDNLQTYYDNTTGLQNAATMTTNAATRAGAEKDYLSKFNAAYAKGGKVEGAAVEPVVTEGGEAEQIGNGMSLLRGRKHSKGGIKIGKGNKAIEAEDGEVVKVDGNQMKIYSAQNILDGGKESPADEVRMNPEQADQIFAQQEEYKRNNQLNDDGTSYRLGGKSKRKAALGTKALQNIAYGVSAASPIISGIAGLVGSNKVNGITYATPNAPVQYQAANLKTDYNISPQVQEIRETQRNLSSATDRNTISSSAALARKQRIRNNATSDINKLRGDKENIETQLTNQNRLNQQEVYNKNVDLQNKYNSDLIDSQNRSLESDYNAKLTRLSERNAAINSIASGVSGAASNYISNTLKGNVDQKSLLAAAAGDTSASIYRLIQMGVIDDPAILKALYDNTMDEKQKAFLAKKLKP